MVGKVARIITVTFMIIGLLYAGPAVSVYAEELGQQVENQEQEQAKRRQPTFEQDGITMLIRTSPDAEMETRLEMIQPQLAKSLKDALNSGNAKKPVDHLPLSDVYVRLPTDQAEYMVSPAGELLSERSMTAIALPIKARTQLLTYAQKLKEVHYGQPLPWKEAKKIVPMKEIITVVDVETGMSFKAQRRAGRNHADVQPLTAKDSAIMKQIYDGEWSWRRKAILVKSNGRTLAASMHGMPHGGDGIPGNNFAGHFCIHFLDSTTHRSKQTDPDHQLMVWKASGEIDLYLARMSPEEVVDTFYTAMRVKDPNIIKRLFVRADDPQAKEYASVRDQYVQIEKQTVTQEKNGDSLLTVQIKADTRVFPAGGGKPTRRTLLFKLQRGSPADPWKIAGVEEER